jgi:hypothetical protein
VRRNTIIAAQEALSSFTRRCPTRSICGSRLSLDPQNGSMGDLHLN